MKLFIIDVRVKNGMILTEIKLIQICFWSFYYIAINIKLTELNSIEKNETNCYLFYIDKTTFDPSQYYFYNSN